MNAASRPAASSQTIAAPAAPALSETSRVVAARPEAAGMLTMRRRGRRTCRRFQSGHSRDQQIERADRLPGADHQTALGDIAAAAANALPRRRLRQHLNQRAIVVDQIGVDHAIAAIRHPVAGLDPERRLSQWQRRVGRTHRRGRGRATPSRRRRPYRRPDLPAERACPPQPSPTPAPAASRSARPASVPAAAAPAPRRAEQAKPAGAGSRS